MRKSNTSKSQDKTENEFKESEQRYRTTLMSVGYGVIATDTEGRVEMMNPVAEELTGWKQEEAKGNLLEKIFQIINEETRQIVENPVRRVMREGIVVGLANHSMLIAINGTEYPIADSGAPIRNEEGDITGMVLVFRDQTRERAAQKALKENEAKYKALFENAQVGMYRSMIDGSAMLDVNNKFIEILGFTRDELLGKAGRILWADPEDRNKMMKLLKEQDGILYNYEARLLAKNGEVKDVLASIELHPVEGSLDGTFFDITNRKRAEEALLASESRYRSYIEATGQIGWVTNADGEVVEDVPSLRKFTGQTYKEAKGSGWAKALHPDDLERSLKVWNTAMTTKSFYEIGYRMRRHDGVYRYMLARGFPIFREDESIREWVGTCIDITELKQAEELLRMSEENYRTLFNSLMEGYCIIEMVFDADGKPVDYRFLEINQAFEEQTGLHEAQGKLMRELAPEHEEHWFEIYGKIALTGETAWFENEAKALNRWYEVRASRVGGQESRKVIICFNDITERKKAEEQLRKLNRTYSLLSDINQAIVRTRVPKELFEKVCNIAVGQGGFGMAWIGLIDDSSQKLRVIAQAGRTTGYLEHIDISLNGEPLSYCPVDSALRHGKHNICKIIENEEMATCQKIAYELGFRSSGSFPLKVSDILKGALTFYSDEPEFFDEKELKLLDELALDISFAMEYAEKEAGRKKAEKALQESEDKFKYVFDRSVIGKSITLPSGEIHVNKAFCDMLGYSREELEGTKWQDISHPEDNELTQKMINSLISGEKDSVRFIKRYLHKNGAVVWTDVGTALRRDDDGNPLYLMTAINNITDRKQAEEEIRKLNFELEDRVVMRTAQLEASYKELEAFSYSVSHDLRAPLRHVSGYVELLNKHFQSDLPEKGQHYLNSIADSVRIMGMLIDDLLQFSRTGRTEMHQSDLDMNEIVKEVKESLCKDNPDRKIEWVLGKLPSVNGDEAMLRLVWTNLLSNSVKFTRTRKKARIEIGVRKENKELVFFVRDNGVGFDMKYAQKLFGVFQRLHPTEEFEGTGIGLANVHRIVLRHGGRTWAEAEPDKGAVFYFSIPNK